MIDTEAREKGECIDREGRKMGGNGRQTEEIWMDG